MTTPDVWVILELHDSTTDQTAHRILVGWYGGFAGSNSWRMSSGIVKIVDKDSYWEIHNRSGSIYRCHKEIERFSGYTQSIYESYANQSDSKLSLKKVNINDILQQYNISQE